MLAGFLNEINLCISRQNGKRLAEIFTITNPAQNTGFHNGGGGAALFEECHHQFKLEVEEEELIKFKQKHLGNDQFGGGEEGILWRDIICNHLKVIMYRRMPDSIDGAFLEQATLLQTLQRIFMNCTKWILPLVYIVNEELWVLAINEEQQQECARLVNKTVTICLTDRASIFESRKWGVYRTVSLLFKIYFKLGQLNLCSNVLRAMGAADLPNPTLYPTSHLVAFRYLLGRFYFINEQYSNAEKELYLAFSHCPTKSIRNKRLLLHFLIPLRILQSGLCPSPLLLNRYNLHLNFYSEALKALALGDLLAFSKLLIKFEASLLRLGTFLLWERLSIIAYRNFLRRIFLINGSNTRLALEVLRAPLKLLGQSLDIDEIACLVANLISRGFLKGYISQEKATIVLSQKDPFPSLQTVMQQQL